MKHKKLALAIILVFYFVIIPLVITIVHGLVMGKFTYKKYDSEKYLLYEDVAKDYPRKLIRIFSGKNKLSAYLYGEENSKGLIVTVPGHGDANDIKLYEICYFVDSGYQVICFDYTGCYTSEGRAFGGYTQALYDLDAVLSYCDDNYDFAEMPVYLFGHSLGAYAVTAVLNYNHRVDAVVSTSGFDNAAEQWECSIKRFTGPAYFLIRPINLAFIRLKYGKDSKLSAVKGINSKDIPVLVISAEDDVFYGGKKSPIYDKRKEITNDKCNFILMDKENHNGHYSYYLTDEALAYQKSNPQNPVDKQLYMQHDEKILKMIIDFYEGKADFEEAR